MNRREKEHSFSPSCVAFWREQLDDYIADLVYSRIKALDLKRLRPVIRDTGEKIAGVPRLPTAGELRAEQGGRWLVALQDQVANAAPSQIAQYAEAWFHGAHLGSSFECSACGFGE